MADGMGIIPQTMDRMSLLKTPVALGKPLTELFEIFLRMMSSRGIVHLPAASSFFQIRQRLATLIGFVETKPKPEFANLSLSVTQEGFRFRDLRLPEPPTDKTSCTGRYTSQSKSRCTRCARSAAPLPKPFAPAPKIWHAVFVEKTILAYE